MNETWSMAHDPEGNFLVVKFSEDFSLGELDQVAQAIDAADNLELNRLFDFSSSTGLAPTTTELLALARQSAEWPLDGVRIAWLAASQTEAGLLRIITTKFSEQVMKVFTSQPEARRWLAGNSTAVQDSPGQVQHYPIRLRGDITADMVMKTLQEIREAEGYSPELPLLWDLRECRAKESLDVLKEMAVFFAGNFSRDRLGSKSAVLVDSHFNELILREMGKASGLDGSKEIVVFRSYRDAMAWLAK